MIFSQKTDFFRFLLSPQSISAQKIKIYQIKGPELKVLPASFKRYIKKKWCLLHFLRKYPLFCVSGIVSSLHCSAASLLENSW